MNTFTNRNKFRYYEQNQHLLLLEKGTDSQICYVINFKSFQLKLIESICY